MEIIQSILTNNPCYRAGKKIKVRGLMLHSVGCPQPKAETFVKKWNNPASGRACVHAFIDGKTGKVYQTLPWDHRAWHCGGSANGTHIGVEMCEPACIRYIGGASFSCFDRDAAMAVITRTYDTAVELFAYLCKQYGLDPLADGVIISHKEGHDRGLASGHGDPDHLWKGVNCEYSMDTFRRAVAAAMGQTRAVNTSTAVAAEAAGESGQRAARTAADYGSVSAGDVVSLAPDAVYYTGKEMPAWVKNDRWIVKSLSGDRAVIDKNVSGSSSINSPVNLCYLTVVSKGQTSTAQNPAGTTPAQAAAVQAAATQPAGTLTQAAESGAGNSAGNMAVSERGVELVAKYEGCRLQAYKCPAGVWTIGYGHTAGVKPGDTLPSQEYAKKLLKEDLAKYAASVNNCVKKGLIAFPLTQNQFDALTSFCYNCGAGSLQKLVTGRSAAEVADKLPAYNKGGGKVLAGLVKRREEERALFLS